MTTTNKKSLISILFISFISVSPRLKRYLWKKWYNLLARKDKNSILTSMNYGYEDNSNPINEEINSHLKLYEHIIHKVSLEKKRILEIGSGRGAGAQHLAKKYQPDIYIGLDLANHAIKKSGQLDRQYNTCFLTGNALMLPIKSETMDIVINVESSHCYNNLELFIQQVSTVLRKDGYFCYCDLMPVSRIKELHSYFEKYSLSIIDENDITTNILQSLDKNSTKHELEINENVPRYLRKTFSDFVGIKNSGMYDLFNSGKYSYYSFLLKKTTDSNE